jgi:hypothetical protein
MSKERAIQGTVAEVYYQSWSGMHSSMAVITRVRVQVQGKEAVWADIFDYIPEIQEGDRAEATVRETGIFSKKDKVVTLIVTDATGRKRSFTFGD